MASGQTLKTVIAVGGKLLPTFNTTFGSVNNQFAKSNMKAAQLVKANKNLSTSYKAVGLAAATATTAVLYSAASMVKKGVQLSSDLQESQNVIDVTFEKSSSQINAWAKAAKKSYGLSELAAKQYSGTMGAMLKSTGLTGNALSDMSTSLSGLAGDFASFYNISTDLAFEKIRSGISGETEPLKQIGIDMSVTNLQAYALAKGIKKNYSEMNAATKAALRYSYLMSVSADAHGDFGRTQENYANQQRLFSINTQEMAMALNTGLVPIMTKVYRMFNRKMESMDMSKVADNITAFGNKAFDVLSGIYNFTVTNWPFIKAVLKGAAMYLVANKVAVTGLWIAMNRGNVMAFASNMLWWVSSLNQSRKAIGLIKTAQLAWNLAMTANPIGAVTMAVFAAGAAIYALYKNWDKVVKFFKDSWSWIKKIFGGTSEAYGEADGKATYAAKTRGMRRYANGGFASVPSIFGEAGREAAIPIKRTPRSISLLNQTASLLGVGGGGNITFAPVIYVDGGKGDVEGQVTRGVKAAYPEFERIVSRHREGREVYA